MKKLLLITLISAFFNVEANAQSYINNWLVQQGTGGFLTTTNMCTDNAGNIYKVGHFQLSPDFDPGSGTNTITSNGANDIFIQKLDPSGNVIWVKTVGGTGVDFGKDIAVDVLGNVYIVGDFNGTVDFDPSNSTVNKVSFGGEDAFVLKLNSLGDYQWVKTAGGTGSDIAESISLDNSANIYVAGSYEISASFDLLASGSNLTSNGQNDAFVWKLSATGSFTWVKTIGGPSFDYGYEIEVDGIGNSYIGGKARSGIDFDPGTSVFTGVNNGGYDAYIVSLDASGNFQWANTFGGTGEDKVKEITLSTTNGLYVSGSFNSTVDFDPLGAGLSISALSSHELFIQNLDVSGNFTWAKAFAGCLSLSNSYIKESSNTNIIFCGGFSGTADFDPNGGTQLVVSSGNVDVFFEELDVSGNYVDVFTMGGGSGDKGVSLVLDTADAVVLTGSASSNFDFNPNGTSLTPGFKTDYTAKYILCTSSVGVDLQTACSTYDWIDGNTYTSSNSIATHTIEGGATNGCDSVVTLNLTINTVDTAVFQTGNELTGSATGANYQWLDCNNANAEIAGEINQVFTTSFNGSFALETTEDGCVDTSSCYSVFTVGVSEVYFSNQINIYPNPTNGQFNVLFRHYFEKYNIEIIDVGGRILYQKDTKNKQIVKLKFEAPEGIYFVRINTGENQSIIKLIKQ